MSDHNPFASLRSEGDDDYLDDDAVDKVHVKETETRPTESEISNAPQPQTTSVDYCIKRGSMILTALNSPSSVVAGSKAKKISHQTHLMSDAMQVHKDLKRYYRSFALFDTSTPEDLIRRVLQPNLIR